MERVGGKGFLIRREGVLAKSSGGSLVLLDIDSGAYFSTNEVGARVWELADGTRSLAAIIGAVAAEYDAPFDVIEADVVELVADFTRESLLSRRVP
jgi:hypothetical protein